MARPTSSARQGRPVTLRDVAREAGVSVSTASRALTPGFTRISDEAVERVRAAVQLLGYRPDFSAKATSTGSSTFVAVVVSDIRDPFNSEIAHGVARAAAAQGLVATIAGAGERGGGASRVIRQLRGVQPCALVLVEPRAQEPAGDQMTEELERYRDRGGQVAVVGEPLGPAHQVVLSWREGAEALVMALVGQGYLRPAVIAVDVGSAAMGEWRRGLEQGARAAGVDLAVTLAPRSGMSRDGGYWAAQQILASSRRAADVIICASDTMAVGAMAAVRQAGLTPGRDVGLAGCDDLVTTDEVSQPHITSLAGPEAGRRRSRGLAPVSDPGRGRSGHHGLPGRAETEHAFPTGGPGRRLRP